MEKLTKKQQGFVKDYVETGNGTQAALKNYDTDSYGAAAVIANENLNKPKVQEAIRSIGERFNEDDIAAKHQELLNAVNLERLNFSPKDTDEVIEEAISKMPGYKLIKIVTNTNGSNVVDSKYAYVAAPDNMTQDKALDKVYKLKGAYSDGNSTINIGKLQAILVKFIDDKDDKDTKGIQEAV